MPVGTPVVMISRDMLLADLNRVSKELAEETHSLRVIQNIEWYKRSNAYNDILCEMKKRVAQLTQRRDHLEEILFSHTAKASGASSRNYWGLGAFDTAATLALIAGIVVSALFLSNPWMGLTIAGIVVGYFVIVGLVHLVRGVLNREEKVSGMDGVMVVQTGAGLSPSASASPQAQAAAAPVVLSNASAPATAAAPAVPVTAAPATPTATDKPCA